MDLESLALQAGVIQVQHQEAPDTKERNRLRKAEDRLKSTALGKAKEMALWQKLGGVAEANRGMTEQQWSAMIRGEDPPWGKTVMSPTALQMYHGRRLCLTRADIDRCTEELRILPVEFQRLSVWLKQLLQRVDQEVLQPAPSLVRLAEAPGKALGEWVAAPAAVRKSRQFWLLQHKGMLAAMQASGLKLRLEQLSGLTS